MTCLYSLMHTLDVINKRVEESQGKSAFLAEPLKHIRFSQQISANTGSKRPKATLVYECQWFTICICVYAFC